MTNAQARGLLLLTVVALYGQTLDFGFLSLDDEHFIVNNQVIAGGLNWDALVQAWGKRGDGEVYFTPIIRTFQMGLVELFGLRAAAFHGASVVLFAANALLLWQWLRKLGALPWPAWLASLLFVVHPLHVAAGAWALQHKELVSALFGLLSLLAYLSYVERRGTEKARERYLLLLLAFTCSLLSKPMWVTLPGMLLLLDGFPLGRWRREGWGWLLLEKLPLVLLALFVVLLATLLRWSSGDAYYATYALLPGQHPLGYWGIISSVPLSYWVFTYKTLVPWPLAMPYLGVTGVPPWGELAVGGAALLGLTGAALWQWRRRPWLTVGWLWFVGVLATVVLSVGGSQLTPFADHWSYVPHMGVALALAWSLPETGRWVAAGRLAAAALAGVFLLVSSHYLPTWRDSEALWRNAWEVSGQRLDLAVSALGILKAQEGDHARGLILLRQAQTLNPREGLHVVRTAQLLGLAGQPRAMAEEYARLFGDGVASTPLQLLMAATDSFGLKAYGQSLALLARLMDAEGIGNSRTLAPARVLIWLALFLDGQEADERAYLDYLLAGGGRTRALRCRQLVAMLPVKGEFALERSRVAERLAAVCPE